MYFFPKLNSKSGLTLLELILYIFIITSISGLIAQTLISITTTKQKIDARKTVDENLDFALKKIESEVKKAKTTEVNAAGDILTLTLEDDSTVIFFIDSSVLQKKVGGVDYPITSNEVIVTSINGVLFSKIEHPATIETIQVKIKVSYDSQDLKLSSIASQIQTTVSPR